ncbi:3'-5' exonuclease [Dysgonomonas sp. 521]|uniref:3'-5' exonuclease n=1 Tax=Dysgonomonas sp. 521 TaxID=2302932 RepID=UPI0013D8C655|nr:3'-5' exonuclease [Dysgonomonas sp. 521]NDV96454.1 3'-5' exonuclease [Dysgonomonas sp. 521]
MMDCFLIFATIVIIIIVIIIFSKGKSESSKNIYPNDEYKNLYDSASNRNSNTLKSRHRQSSAIMNEMVDYDGTNLAVQLFKSKTNDPYFLVVDVETTGITRIKEVNNKNCKRLPRIVQIAWVVLDKDFRKVKGATSIIKQDQPIPEKSTDVHGITDEQAEKEGHDIKDVLDEFLEDISNCKILVAHNMEFDHAIIKGEIMRLKKSTLSFDSIAQYCTMFWGQFFCKIPRHDQSSLLYDIEYKYPKLQELLGFLFLGNTYAYFKGGFHDASMDVLWTTACLKEMYKIKRINFEAIIERNNKEIEEDKINKASGITELDKNETYANKTNKELRDELNIDISKIINSITFSELKEDNERIINQFISLKNSSDIKTFYHIICPHKPYFHPIKEISFKYKHLSGNDFELEYEYLLEDNDSIRNSDTFTLETEEDKIYSKAQKYENIDINESIKLYIQIVECRFSHIGVYFRALNRLSVILGKIKRHDLDIILLTKGLKVLEVALSDTSGYLREYCISQIRERLEKSKKKVK